MQKLLIALFVAAALCLTGCGGCSSENSTIGDGQVDAVEAATIQVAVGLAMTAAPETIAPAYAVSTGLLALLDGQQLVTLAGLDGAIAEKINQLELSQVERQSAFDLVTLIRAKLRSKLDAAGVPEADRFVVVQAVVQIVHDSAAARLGVAQ